MIVQQGLWPSFLHVSNLVPMLSAGSAGAKRDPSDMKAPVAQQEAKRARLETQQQNGSSAAAAPAQQAPFDSSRGSAAQPQQPEGEAEAEAEFAGVKQAHAEPVPAQTPLYKRPKARARPANPDGKM